MDKLKKWRDLEREKSVGRGSWKKQSLLVKSSVIVKAQFAERDPLVSCRFRVSLAGSGIRAQEALNVMSARLGWACFNLVIFSLSRMTSAVWNHQHPILKKVGASEVGMVGHILTFQIRVL